MTRPSAFVVALLAAAAATAAVIADPAASPASQGTLAPYTATPQEVVDRMLQMAEVTKGDVVYDLGSGDGRLVITAARQYGARGVGIDIDPKRIEEANENAKAAGVTGKVTFLNQDLFTSDFKEATVVTLYLLPSLNERLIPQLKALKPGTRIVSHAFDMGDWKAEKELDVDGRKVYFWTIPKK